MISQTHSTQIFPSVVDLSQLSFTFGSNYFAVAQVDLQVRPGEVVGFLGRNGAGKTTLLRCIAGILAPTAGQARVFGLDPLAAGVEVKRRTGYVNEERNEIKGMTVKGWMAIHRRLYPTWDDDYARELLERFDVLEARQFKHLSKGQSRIASLCCALAHRPELLILDEPSGGLDPLARRTFLELLLPVLGESETTVLFSSHHLQDIERIASRIVLMDRGQVVLDDAMDAATEGVTLVAIEGATHQDLQLAQRYGEVFSERSSQEGAHLLLRGAPDQVSDELGPKLPPTRTSFQAVSLEDLCLEVMGGQQ